MAPFFNSRPKSVTLISIFPDTSKASLSVLKKTNYPNASKKTVSKSLHKKIK